MARFIGYVVASTDRAVLFLDHFWSAPDWMPKSQITVLPRDFDSMEVQLDASPWICNQKGIREFQYREVADDADRK